jgi:hypothetical protein
MQLLLRGLALAIACAACSTYPRTVTLNVYSAADARGGYVVPLGQRADTPHAEGRSVLVPIAGARVSCPAPCSRFVDRGDEGLYEVTISEPAPPVDHVDVLVERVGFEPAVVRVPLNGEPPYATRLVVLLSPREAP